LTFKRTLEIESMQSSTIETQKCVCWVIDIQKKP
jgi:hypothetical protein